MSGGRPRKPPKVSRPPHPGASLRLQRLPTAGGTCPTDRPGPPIRRTGSAFARPRRTGDPFLVYRDEAGVQRIVRLGGEQTLAVIGRAASSDIPIDWDDRVSRTHAKLERVGREWSIEDDGLSRNGTFVNEERVRGPRRLRDGDMVRAGHTTLVFRTPSSPGTSRPTQPESRLAAPPPLSIAQRRVLDALCRPVPRPDRPADARHQRADRRRAVTSASTPSRRTCASSTGASTSRTCPRSRSGRRWCASPSAPAWWAAGRSRRGEVCRDAHLGSVALGARVAQSPAGDAGGAARDVRAGVERPRPRAPARLLRAGRRPRVPAAAALPVARAPRPRGPRARGHRRGHRPAAPTPCRTCPSRSSSAAYSSDRRLWTEWRMAGTVARLGRWRARERPVEVLGVSVFRLSNEGFLEERLYWDSALVLGTRGRGPRLITGPRRRSVRERPRACRQSKGDPPEADGDPGPRVPQATVTAVPQTGGPDPCGPTDRPRPTRGFGPRRYRVRGPPGRPRTASGSLGSTSSPRPPSRGCTSRSPPAGCAR